MSLYFGNVQQTGDGKTYLYKNGVNIANFAFDSSSGDVLYSFESDHIRVYKTGAGGSAITFISDPVVDGNIGDTIVFVYDDLTYTSGLIVDIEVNTVGWALPSAKVTNPAATTTPITITSGASPQELINDTCRLVFRNDQAIFDLKIREIYLH